ncbi:MAG: dihydrolipoamide acetyltransferase family protein [Fermentimonas sp.]|jgi:pyruvate dehydrogenase E2 component (dihydrolipoamide acetyltransferase)
MKYIFNFPDLGEGLEEGTILEWFVKAGDSVRVGDPLVQMETDKVVADIPSPRAGVIEKVYGEVGEVVKVGSPLVEFVLEKDESVADKEVNDADNGDNDSEDEAVSVVGTVELASEKDIIESSRELEKDRRLLENMRKKVLSTPVARALAKRMGVDINDVKGSGPSGRIRKDDVMNHNSDVTYLPLTQIRKTIAKNMLFAKHNAAHISVFEEIEISQLMDVRARYKDKFASKGVNLTYLPFIVKAVAQALIHHPQLNSQIDMENNRMIVRNRRHIGVAVDAPDGLVVPVIRDADKLSIFSIAKQIGELAAKARTRELSLDNLRDGSFSITSFGSIGGIFATPVLNYPQAGILGIGRIMKTPIVRDDEIVVGHIMPISLTVDHRVVDGGEATRFIYKIMEYLADPVAFIMEEV